MDLFARTQWLRDHRWTGYAVAVAGPLAGIAIRFALGDALTGFPFITFFPAILLAAAVGGVAPGVLATVLSGLLSAWFLIAPHGTLSVSWPSGWIGLLSFAAVAATMIALMDVAIRAGTRLDRARRQLSAGNDRLEAAVAERTRELTLLAAQLRQEIATKEEAEAQIRQMQKVQALGQLTGGIAHDFNNMLSIIMGSLEIARRRMMQGRTDIDRYVDNALDGAGRAATLTHQLLAFSRQQPLAPVIVDGNALVSGMAELLRRTLGETVELECVLAGGLWRARVDPGQLEHALVNLAVNARDAMPGGGKLTIETQNAHLDDDYAAHAEVAPGQYVLVAATDTGTGMAPDVAARAFDPFFTTKAEGRGTGLGLSQVYGFIRQSEGHIKIYSEPGHGTSIKIYLPRHIAGPAAAAVNGEPAANATVPPGSPNETVLVVDDDDAVRGVHVNMLRELNYTVRDAGSGADAIALMRRQDGIDLLFTDVVMPGMGGRELADAARDLLPELKVLFTTGYTPNAVVHNGVIDRDVDLLPKPFAFDQLARKVRLILDRR